MDLLLPTCQRLPGPGRRTHLRCPRPPPFRPELHLRARERQSPRRRDAEGEAGSASAGRAPRQEQGWSPLGWLREPCGRGSGRRAEPRRGWEASKAQGMWRLAALLFQSILNGEPAGRADFGGRWAKGGELRRDWRVDRITSRFSSSPVTSSGTKKRKKMLSNNRN